MTESHITLTPQRTCFLEPDDGVFELPGLPAAWIWVCTCAEPECDCRTAVVLATHDGRDALLERVAPVYAAWSKPGGRYHHVATEIQTLIGFLIDIDDAVVYALQPGELVPLDLQAHPAIAELASRIRGPLLDRFDELWHHGKGLPAACDEPLQFDMLEELDLESGDLLGWTEVCDARNDLYPLAGHRYERLDLYCIQPHCRCREVVIAFENGLDPDGDEPGTVVLHLDGKVELQPVRADDHRLAQLWAAFQQRYPNYLELLKGRNSTIKQLARPLFKEPVRVLAKPGRNDPCPCGSGKKYKKCCGAN